jgi:DNA-binding CsgD family transcriptional regulator
MSSQNQGALSLLERLHGAPGDAAAWLGFLEALQQAISPDCLVVAAAYDTKDRSQGHLVCPALGVLGTGYDEILSGFRHPALAELPVGGVLAVPAEPGFYQTPFFREVLTPAGACPGAGLVAVLHRSGHRIQEAVMVLPCAPGWGPTLADRELLEWLTPHMVIGRRVHLLLADSRREEEALVSTFDRLLLGVVFTDDKGCISYANRSAAELIGHPAGFSEPGAVLDDHTRAWRELLAGGSRGAIVRAPDDGRPIQVLDAPFDWSSHQHFAASRFVRAFFIADPKQSSGDPIQVLRELYGLTQSETRLATLLLADCSLKEAARLLGITHTTARSVLKGIFAKTGTNRQAELVRLLIRGPMGQLRTRSEQGQRHRPEPIDLADGRPRRRARG